MLSHLRANLWLLGLSLLLCCVIYPGILLVFGQTLFPSQADGSLIFDQAGKPIGSRLIAQPFTGDEYFQPRPSAVSYNAAASGASNWGANNYLLRDRVARQLGPIVKYRSGAKADNWLARTSRTGSSRIARAASRESSPNGPRPIRRSRRTGSKPTPPTPPIVTAWQSTHAAEVAQWSKENPDNPQPKPEDLAVVFFTSFSHDTPRHFSGRRRAQDRRTAKPKSESSPSRRARKSSRPSSTCGGRTTRKPTWNRCRPTW